MYYLVILLIVFTSLVSEMATTLKASQAQQTTSSVGDTMAVFAGYVDGYAAANPTFTGVPTVTALALPSWYVIPVNVGAYIQSGQAYVYYVGAAQGLPAYLVAKYHNDYKAGTDVNGVLQSPMLTSAATSTMTIPSQVPSNSVVIMP